MRMNYMTQLCDKRTASLFALACLVCLALETLLASAAFADLAIPRKARAPRPVPTRNIQNENEEMKKLDPTTEETPFAGLAAKSEEERAEALAGLTPEQRLQEAENLNAKRMNADAIAMVAAALTDDADEKTYIAALRRYVSFSLSFRTDDQTPERVEAKFAKALESRPESWRVKTAIADLLERLPQIGYLEEGVFKYTYQWRQDLLSTRDRTLVRRMQLYAEALPLVRAEGATLVEYFDANPNVVDSKSVVLNTPEQIEQWSRISMLRGEISNYFQSFALLFQRQPHEYWMMQKLTDIANLPDYVPNDYAHARNRNAGAPVDENGDPIFFETPASFEESKNDGERVFALQEESLRYDRYNTSRANVLRERANYAQQLFGVQTLSSYNFFFNRDADDDAEQRQGGIWALNTLEDNETIAKLANGVKRFALPANYDYIALWNETLEYDGPNFHILSQLAREYENRRQLDKAAQVWERALELNDDRANEALSQIRDPRVALDNSSVVAGTNVDLALRFRNAKSAEVNIRELNVDVALNVVRNDSFWQEQGDGALGEVVRSMVYDELNPESSKMKSVFNKFLGKKRVVGKEVARYSVELEPDPAHYDKIKKIGFPISEPGAYLVEIEAKNGNKDAAIVWLRETAIVYKPFQNGWRCFALDAKSGEPKRNAVVEFFVVNRSWDNGKNRVKTRRFKEKTDANGSIQFKDKDMNFDNSSVSVMTVVPSTTKSKRADAQFGFKDMLGIWRVYSNDDRFENTRAFFVSDRPIYRPKQTAKFSFILGTAQYDKSANSEWAGQEVEYRITSPAGEEVARKRVTLDEYGAFNDEFEIAEDAKLGVYFVQLCDEFDENGGARRYFGDGTFRLEEYRKPEFQVTVDAPKDPVALGDKFKAKVNAKYYFGAPVVNADVSYKVTRTNYRSKFYPPRYWDWFYGPGYWQFTYDCPWYPGWLRWGCVKLPPFYSDHSFGVPEVVAEGEARIDEEGNFEIEIDSSLAKTLYPNDDQQYEISVEVTDESRRTITGNGKVIVAREPFKTYVWFDRGYYRVGDKMELNFQARRLDGKAVEGAAVAKLYKVAYEQTDDASVKPIETEVYAEELKTDENGKGVVALTASEPGQYRASCVVTTAQGVVEEGAQLIIVRGVESATVANSDFRFNALEIVPDKPEYSVGDVAHIQLASNNPNAYVLWTARPQGGVTLGEPQFVKLEKGVAYVDVKIETADQPNIFVQATTVFDGKLYQEQRELAVPPEKRVLDVAVEPASDRVRPGEKATVKLRLTDPEGNPVVGQTVVTVYDKSLEAISGGSNVQDIREFFWKWRRYAMLQSQDNLNEANYSNAFGLLYANVSGKAAPLRAIGVFGNEGVYSDLGVPMGMMTRSRNFGGMGGGVMARSRAARRESGDVMVEEEVDMVMDEASAEPAPMMMDAVEMSFSAAPMEAKATVAMNGAMSAPMEAAADDSDGGEQEAPMVEAVVRSNLADLAYWAADLKSSDDGVIEIEIDMPDNLTTWKIGAWTVGEGLRVGSGEAEIVTSKDVIVRMQKPRFLTQKDEPVFTANVHNYLTSEKKVQVSLETTEELQFAEGVEPVQTLVVPANGEARVDWALKAVGFGEATVTMKALTNEESDAIQEKISIKEHGILKQIPVSGVVPPADKDAKDKETQKVRESSFTLTIPEERRPETTNLVVRFSPTLAGAIFDALPYMVEYPYGCTEQTLNRFLPLVMAQRALIDAGVDLAALKDKRVNLNAQELGDAQERAKQWNKRKHEPVFDIEEVRKLADEGVAKLQSMQVSDGGWGWFSGAGERSTAYLTALVARGLVIARQCDQHVDQKVLDRATRWLIDHEREQVVKLIRGKAWTDEQKKNANWDEYKLEADSTDVAVYCALSELGVQPSGFSESYVDYEKAKLNAKEQFAIHAVMKEFLWEATDHLPLYPLAAFGVALTQEPNKTADVELRIETILRILSQYRAFDDENQTAWLALGRFNGWLFWTWHGGEFETQAYYLRLLQRVDKATLEKLGIADDASRTIKYLLNNRKHATYWNSTRDTAFCVEAFVEYLNKTNELAPNATVEVLVDGEVKKTVEYSPENLFLVDGTLELGPDELTSGEHTIALRVNGDAPLYYNAYLEYFTLEDPIEKAGLELKTERRYDKLVERENATATVEGGRGQAVDQRVEIYDRVPLNVGDAVVSGDKIEVELIVDSKNDYESILLEDLKPAGFETTESLSGYNGNDLGAYVEYRDDRVCFFCSRLPRGRNSVKYVLRAETPGKFSALPAKIWGMYAPELKGNADEFKTVVEDRK